MNVNRLIFIASLLLNILPGEISIAQGDRKLVRIRVMEDDTRRITPVMVCITNLEDSQVYVPPDGRIAEAPSRPGLFIKGVEFNKNRNWTGPVRMMNGKGSVNGPRTYVYGLLPSVPHWTEPLIYQTSGDFDIRLAPGKWKISLQHGNEYIPVKEEFIITGRKKKITKTFRLKRWINLPERGWYSGDVHVHHPTYKKEFRDYLIAFGKAEDVHVLNMLEMGHHLGTDFKVNGFGEQFRICEDNTCLVSGQEDPRSDFGHIIGLNISEQVRDTSLYNYYDLVFEKLKLQPGAIVGFAHFAWRGDYMPRGFPMYVTTGNIDFVELLQKSRINTLDYYDYLNLGFKITAAAGSDFPWASLIGDVRTFVYCGKKFSLDAWFTGLKEGRSFVTNGPALFLESDGNLPGSVITKSMGSTTELKVTAFSDRSIGTIERVEIYNNDGIVQAKHNDAARDSVRIELNYTLGKSQWVAAVVYCTNGAVAHTTPLYFVIDGKPTYDVKKGPLIIKKQIDAIEVVRAEELAKVPVDKGILERFDKAKKFYLDLLAEMRTQQ